LYHQVFLKTTKFLSGLAQDNAAWLAKSSARREKLIAVGLVEPEPIPEKVIIPTLDAFLDDYIERHGASRKPATVAVWKQVVANLKEFMPEGIRINQLTAGHAIEFHEKLKARGMATTTIHKRIQFARQFMHEVVDKLMKKANPVWQVILGLSRYSVFLNHRTHRTHGNKTFLRYVMLPCTRVCSVVPCSLATRANTWSQLRSTAPLLTRRWVGSTRHLWKRDGMLAKQTQTGPESGASRQWPLELNSGAMERSSNFNRKFPSLRAPSVLAPGCSDILL
jgi:hypothetical protein